LRLRLAGARRDDIVLTVPELVVRETVNKHREALTEAYAKVSQGLAALERAGAKPPRMDPIDSDVLVQVFSEQLERLLDEAGVERLPIPSTGHEPVVERALRRRMPFNAKGHGYRDALIWETIIALVRQSETGEVVLLTNNTADFADRSTGVLARDLQDDLSELGRPGDFVQLVTDVRVFNDRYLSPETVAKEELTALLAGESALRRQLEDYFSTALFAHSLDLDPHLLVDAALDDLDFESDIEDIEVGDASVAPDAVLHNVQLRRAELLDEDRVLLELEAEIEGTLDVLFEAPGPARNRHKPRHERFEADLVSLDGRVRARAEGVYRPTSGELEDLRVTRGELLAAPPEGPGRRSPS